MKPASIPRVIIRAIENAFNSVLAVKWKSAISMMTILIGSLAISATFTLSENLNLYVEYLIEKSGGPKVLGFRNPPSQYSKQNLEFINRLPIVRSAYPVLSASGYQLRHLDGNVSVKVNAVSSFSKRAFKTSIQDGRIFNDIEFEWGEPVALISKAALERLKSNFLEGMVLILRDKIKRDHVLKIIGIAESDSPYDRGTIWVPEKFFSQIGGDSKYMRIEVLVDHFSWMNWTEGFMKKFVKPDGGGRDWIFNPLAKFKKKTEEMSSLISLGYTLGFLALLAGSVGAMGVMILNINLRKREIGLYKSMGFASLIILLQFCLEVVIISFFGGVIGAFMGGWLGVIIGKNILSFSTFSIMGVLWGLLAAIVTGGIFGLVPAIMAARIDPVKALRGL